MDCGPAALKCLLEGFGIHVSYDRLREACQTGIDGTSIDTMEVVANQLGLKAEQVMIPLDHVTIPEAKVLPALVVVRLPDGMTHFVIVWRRHGNLLQIMDPAAGRRWVTAERFLSDVYRHRMAVPAEGWREFAGSEEFQAVLRRRLIHLKVRAAAVDRLCRTALMDESWRSLAALDAAVRLLSSLAGARAITDGEECLRVLNEFQHEPELIPPQFWSAAPTDPDEEGVEQLVITGAVLVRALGRADVPAEEPISAELRAAITERPLRPDLELARYLWQSGPLSLFVFAIALILSAGGVLIEALLFRGLFDLTSQLHVAGQRIGGMAAIVIFSSILLAFDFTLFAEGLRLARHIEARLRVAFMRKIPKLGDRYFQSRLTSDMAERSHAAHHLRHLPDLIRQLAGSALKLVFTAGALIWLQPSGWPFVLLIALSALVPPFAAQSMLAERDLRVRSHAGALTRFYLDAMLGLVTIRAHGAERSLRREQQKLLGDWAEAAIRLQKTVVRLEALQLTAMFGFAAWLLLSHPLYEAEIGRVLLMIYWALNLPVYGQDIAALARRYPYYRNLTRRLLDPLGAPEEARGKRDSATAALAVAPAIRIRDVSLTASGHKILDGIHLDIASGSHVAIVGPSGAGKSSLVGLLLGWSKPSVGEIEVNGCALDCEQLLRSGAWVDPAVQLWNRSLLSNIRYGSSTDAAAVGQAVDDAMLRGVLESLPEGLQTNLGEGGGLVSGGEGQRVRLARAMVGRDVRLVIFDEPFRGLDREKRHELLSRSRSLWHDCTLICVTHDIDETRQFDRVIVIENGRIAEQGCPRELTARAGSRYAQLLRAEAQTRSGLWSSRNWRRIRVQSGRTVETIREPAQEIEAEVA